MTTGKTVCDGSILHDLLLVRLAIGIGNNIDAALLFILNELVLLVFSLKEKYKFADKNTILSVQ